MEVQRKWTHWAKRISAYVMRSTALHVPFKLFSVALIAATVLLVTSCRSTTKATRQVAQSQDVLTTDSVTQHERTTTALWTQPIRADTTRLELRLDSTLLSLPEGASFTAASGRAHLKASLKRDEKGRPASIIIEGGCDSLQRLCIYYQAEAERLQTANTQLQSIVKTLSTDLHTRGRTWNVWAALALLAVVLILIIANRQIKE